MSFDAGHSFGEGFTRGMPCKDKHFKGKKILEANKSVPYNLSPIFNLGLSAQGFFIKLLTCFNLARKFACFIELITSDVKLTFS